MRKHVYSREMGEGTELGEFLSWDPAKMKEYFGDEEFNIYITQNGSPSDIVVGGDHLAFANFRREPMYFFSRFISGKIVGDDGLKYLRDHGIDTSRGGSINFDYATSKAGLNGELPTEERKNLLVELNNGGIQIARRMRIPFMTSIPKHLLGELDGNITLYNENNSFWIDLISESPSLVSYAIIE
ncbi:MAG: hypothetical protein JW754_06035 [Candidatus Aenigmarchaeota archaeon]|nr:hypothetical protein [Candidatus Aenigmarchaeota archaeon]